MGENGGGGENWEGEGGGWVCNTREAIKRVKAPKGSNSRRERSSPKTVDLLTCRPLKPQLP